jgi:hypothetical protein
MVQERVGKFFFINQRFSQIFERKLTFQCMAAQILGAFKSLEKISVFLRL